MEEFKETLSFTFRLTSFISIPAMVGLIALKTPIINLLFQRGVFDYGATEMTARALFFYCVGLWAIAGARTIVPAFYSLQDTRTPLKIGLVCLGANVVFIAILIQPLKHGGLALATSLSSTLNLILLFWKLNSKIGKMDMTKNIRVSSEGCFLQPSDGFGCLFDLFHRKLVYCRLRWGEGFTSVHWDCDWPRNLFDMLLLDQE